MSPVGYGCASMYTQYEYIQYMSIWKCGDTPPDTCGAAKPRQQILKYSLLGAGLGKSRQVEASRRLESYHFEWPHIHVTKEMAVSTRAQTIKIFEEKSGDCEHLLAKMLEKSRNLNLWNSWERIFDASTTNKGTGSRLPFCDKRSKLLDGQFIDEDRRVMPVVEVLFEFAGDECVRARPMAWRKDRTDAL